MSSHDSGHRLSSVGSVLSSEDEVRIGMEPEGSPSDNNSSMLKKNSSPYLFIPRGLSSGAWKSSSSLTSGSRSDNQSVTVLII